MAAANGHEGFKTNVENYLEPLPSLKAAPSVERLDAGLRSLDHCTVPCYYSVRMWD